MKRLAHSLSALCLVLATLPALAQTATDTPSANTGADAPETASVAVNGVRDPDWKSYQQMLKGVTAYEAGRALAPQAPLRFSLQGEEALLAGVTLRVVGDSVSIPIAVAPDHTFTLPRSREAADEEAELVLNRKKNVVRWRTEIHSPDVPEHARRLGDLRLSCAVNWAILQDDMGFFRRQAVNLLGGLCGTRLIKVYWRTVPPIAAATLVEGERRLPLTVRKDGSGYTVPLFDASWSNEALVQLEAPAPVPAPAPPAPAAEPAPLVAAPAVTPAPQ